MHFEQMNIRCALPSHTRPARHCFALLLDMRDPIGIVNERHSEIVCSQLHRQIQLSMVVSN